MCVCVCVSAPFRPLRVKVSPENDTNASSRQDKENKNGDFLKNAPFKSYGVIFSYETLTLVCFAAVRISSELHFALRPQDTHGSCLFRICVEHYVALYEVTIMPVFIAVYT